MSTQPADRSAISAAQSRLIALNHRLVEEKDPDTQEYLKQLMAEALASATAVSEQINAMKRMFA